MRHSRVTVIIPAFNCAPWILAAIDSVLHQSLPPHQIIVIDDGSTDDTPAILTACQQQIQTIRQPNQGVAIARNTGLAAATGDIIAFLDADDVWHPRKLELQLRALAGSAKIGLLGTGMFDWPATAMPEWTGSDIPAVVTIDRNELAVKNYLSTSSIVARREILEQVGQFDPALHGPEDHDYWLRVAEVATIAILPLQLTGYRALPGSLSNRVRNMETGMQRILQKLDDRDYWRGNRLLRRRAYSHASYSCAYLHGTAGRNWTAITRLLGSLAWYPLPYRRTEAGVSFGRIRRLAMAIFRLTGLTISNPTV